MVILVHLTDDNLMKIYFALPKVVLNDFNGRLFSGKRGMCQICHTLGIATEYGMQIRSH